MKPRVRIEIDTADPEEDDQPSITIQSGFHAETEGPLAGYANIYSEDKYTTGGDAIVMLLVALQALTGVEIKVVDE